MNAAALFGRGISFPPRVQPDGRVAWSEGEQNVRESIRIILMTNLNERLRLPDFGGGLDTFLFEPNNPATHHLMADRIQKALLQWEPRIVLQSVDVQPDPAEPASSAVATIRYKLVATQALERLTVGFTLRS
jgi:uncharacterized protein